VVLGREVDHTWVATGSVQPGEVAGHALIPIDGKVPISQLPIVLIGYMSTNTEGWPPSYADAHFEPLEALGGVMLRLDISEEQYGKYIQFVRDMLADEEFVKFRNSIARALMVVPRLESATIQRLAEIHQIHLDPEPEGELACST
jgi:hypothetical protein